MALFLAGHPPANIMLLGRWRSTAFLQYLRPQILEWTSSLSPSMLRTDDYRDADATLMPTYHHTPPPNPHHLHRLSPPPPPPSPITFHGLPFTQAKTDLMVCPEKDTTPEKRGKGKWQGL
jgi:hypothetical protein